MGCHVSTSTDGSPDTADHGFDGLAPRSRRPHSNPQRTASAVAERIVALRRELAGQGLDHGPQTIGWHLEQEQLPVRSTSTIRRILVAAGLVTPEPKKRPKSSYPAVRSRPAQRVLAIRLHPLAAHR
jgi:hypothetical protein